MNVRFAAAVIHLRITLAMRTTVTVRFRMHKCEKPYTRPASAGTVYGKRKQICPCKRNRCCYAKWKQQHFLLKNNKAQKHKKYENFIEIIRFLLLPWLPNGGKKFFVEEAFCSTCICEEERSCIFLCSNEK